MSFEEQVNEIKKIFQLKEIKVFTECGCRFLYLPTFFQSKKNENLDCLFACDDHLGYPNRLWFSKIFQTTEQKNWNGHNVYINGKVWFAFSVRGKGNTLFEILMSHLVGTK